MERDEQNDIFNLAVSFVCYTNRSIFLTGKAGTGKTTFLKYIREHCNKKMAITAPTGVAAINAGGVTLHSFFQLPFGTYLPDLPSGWGPGGGQNFYNKQQLLSNQRLRSKHRNIIRALELLIIDEVSMVRADLLDAIDTVLRSVRRKPDLPFGGVQLLVIGDLFQLPPVVTQDEEQLLGSYYKSPFFFDAKVMGETEMLPIILEKIYRQQDSKFIGLLNKVRNNRCEEEDLFYLNEYYDPTFIPEDGSGYITLTTHNRTADQINQRALERLSGRTVEISAEIKENFPENAYPAEQVLRLKVGAQIMFIKNDKGEDRRFYNGKIGNIARINSDHKTIEVGFENEPETITVEPETWDNIRYEYDEESDAVKEKRLGSFKQYPIRLAWAVTIHKSQGLTFEKAVIDAGRSFAPGQVYVALSRLTGLEGLVLHSRILPQSIMTNERIQEFMLNNLTEGDYRKTLEQDQYGYVTGLLKQAYDWRNLQESTISFYQGFQYRVIPNKTQALTRVSKWLDHQIELDGIAKKFEHFLTNALAADPVDYKRIHQRNKDASAWFGTQLEKTIGEIQKHIEEELALTRTKKYVGELRNFLQLFENQRVILSRSCELTEALVQSGNLKEAMTNFIAPVPMAEGAVVEKKKAEKGSSARESLRLYQSGFNIAQIAAQRQMAESTITGHLIGFIPTGEVSITTFLPMEDALEIVDASRSIVPFSLTTLKEKMNHRFDFNQLRAALSLSKNENEKK